MDEKHIVNLALEPMPEIDRTPPVEAPPENPPAPAEDPAPQPADQPAPEPPAVPAANLDVDEFGVPWKNRAMEYKRKNEDVIEKLPQLIEEKLKNVTQPQAPQYTYEQLEAYKLQNVSDPSVVAWATGEQRKMQVAENRKLFEEVIGSREQVNKVEVQKQEALRYVQQTYPEAFNVDAQGRPIAWNEQSPMTQQIKTLMQRPDLMNHPEGLSAAADIAYGRLARSQTPVLQQKAKQLQADVKQAQKASLTEGAGRRVTASVTPVQSAVESLRKSGSMQDAQNAIGAILRQKGILGE